MKEEYEALRSEMLKWQDRRFDLIKMSIGLITVLLSLKLIVNSPNSEEVWSLVTSVLLLFLSGSVFLTCYGSIANSKLAAYINIFHEVNSSSSQHGWEGRLKKLKDKNYDKINLNICIAIIYIVLAIISTIIPLLSTDFTFYIFIEKIHLIISLLIFILSIVILFKFSYPRKTYEKYWQEIKDNE